MKDVLEEVRNELERVVWGGAVTTKATNANSELTLDGLYKTMKRMRELMPCVYYAVSKCVPGIDEIFKVDARLCKNGKTCYLIHPDGEAHFIDELQDSLLCLIRIGTEDLFKEMLYGWTKHARLRGEQVDLQT